jgi:immune inhibitor A
MNSKSRLMFAVSIAVLLSILMSLTAAANPAAPGNPFVGPVRPNDTQVAEPAAGPTGRAAAVKPLDQPNFKDYQRNQERMRLSEAGQAAEASALDLTGTDRVLVILVEFAGTDTLTWNPGDVWDPYGKADPNEAVYDADGNVVVGDCSNIITEQKTFTYTGPLHNQIPRPLSAADRSGDTIWTENFSKDWFNSFMFGNGVKFQYARQDGSVVNEDFTGKSVQKYFEDLSANQYHATGDVIGWLQVPHSTWWYGADKCPGNRSGMSSGSGADGGIPGAGSNRSMVRDALDAVNAIKGTIPGFSWKNYDKDGDGVIDRLWIVHAGYGEEDGTTLLNRTDYSEAANWSHSSSVSPLYPVGEGVSAGPYIMMPENGGIGVFAHEYAHNLGAMDLYAYGNGETSTGFWALQADDWTGYPIGYQPPAPDPMHLDWWGWLKPKVISDPSQVYEVTVGQASYFPGGDGVYRGVKIELPTGQAPLPVQPWQGSNFWWGGKADQTNSMMTTAAPIAIPAGGAELSFDAAYGIETEWDFMWVQASEDGTTWTTLTNANTTCDHDEGWIGGLNGFPDDLCAAGIGGFTDYNASFPSPDTETFDLSAFAGKSIWLRLWYMTDWGTTYEGPFVDNVKVKAGATTIFADDAESGDAKWTYAAPWQRSTGLQSFSHNYYLQWRNVGSTGGYDSGLGDPRFRFGPTNTGLLAWYNNNFYNDNEIFNYLTDFPGFGPKGRMLVVDSHPEPYRYPDLLAQGYNNEASNLASRGQMRDAPFSLKDSVSFSYTDPYGWANVPTPQTYTYPGRPAASTFYDAWGYYPGAEFVPGGPVGQTSKRWMTKQWDASTVVPAKEDYGVKAPGYNGTDRFRFGCSLNAAGQVLCYSYASGLGYAGGTGNPGDSNVDYGWRVQILEQSDKTAKLAIWNAHHFGVYAPNKTVALSNEKLTYTYQLNGNEGDDLNLFACAPLDPAKVAYVAGSATNGAVPWTLPCHEVNARLAAGQDLTQPSTAASDPVVSVVWVGHVPAGASASFAFDVTTKIIGTLDDMNLELDWGGPDSVTLPAPPVEIVQAKYNFLPLILR